MSAPYCKRYSISGVGAVTRATADRAALLVELDHLDDVLARDTAIMNRDRVHARVRVDQLEPEWRLRGREPAAPVRANRSFAVQQARRRKAALGDQRRTHLKVVDVVRKDGFEIAAVPRGDPLSGEFACKLSVDDRG